jgi:hypothetical protein
MVMMLVTRLASQKGSKNLSKMVAGAFESATTLLEMPEACTRPACTISTVAVPRVPATEGDAELDAVCPLAAYERDNSTPESMHPTLMPSQLPMDSSMGLRFPQVRLLSATRMLVSFDCSHNAML